MALLLSAVMALAAHAAGDQMVPISGGNEGAGLAGAVIDAGLVDYLEMLNLRDGGINGVHLRWERTAGLGRHPGALALGPDLRGQTAAQIRFIGSSEGGMDRLRGKRIIYLYRNASGSRETIDRLESLAARWQFQLIKLAVFDQAADMRAAWQQIRLLAADWVLLYDPGPTTASALTAAALVGFPARRIIGSGPGDAGQDIPAAGPAATGYITVAINPPGINFAVIRDIVRFVHTQRGVKSMPDEVGSAGYNRGVALGILIGEAIRIAQQRHGAKRLSAEQLQWGLGHLLLDDAALLRLGAHELLPPIDLSCRDHGGARGVKFQQWLGSRWAVVSDWVSGDTLFDLTSGRRPVSGDVAFQGDRLRECAVG